MNKPLQKKNRTIDVATLNMRRKRNVTASTAAKTGTTESRK